MNNKFDLLANDFPLGTKFKSNIDNSILEVIIYKDNNVFKFNGESDEENYITKTRKKYYTQI